MNAEAPAIPRVYGAPRVMEHDVITMGRFSIARMSGEDAYFNNDYDGNAVTDAGWLRGRLTS